MPNILYIYIYMGEMYFLFRFDSINIWRIRFDSW